MITRAVMNNHFELSKHLIETYMIENYADREINNYGNNENYRNAMQTYKNWLNENNK